jgi:hypothetical protein
MDSRVCICSATIPQIVAKNGECDIIFNDCFVFAFLGTHRLCSYHHLPRYPDRTDCPDTERAVNPENEDEPWQNSTNNYFFPDFIKSSCAYGRDYPTWMGDISFEKHYLFRQGSECCTKFFPTASNCPYEQATQAQSGYYWNSYQNNTSNSAPATIKYSHTFYPDLAASACVNGTDYPAWMGSTVEFKRTYLAGTIDGCCTKWFPSQNLNDCKNNVIQGVYDILPCPTNRPDCNATVTITNMTEHLLGMWYPDLGASICKSDGGSPEWMKAAGFAEVYLFNTKEQCCSKFGFSSCT